MLAVEFSLPALSLAGWQQGPTEQKVTLCLHGWLDKRRQLFTPFCLLKRVESGCH
jgi:hypothetical protein